MSLRNRMRRLEGRVGPAPTPPPPRPPEEREAGLRSWIGGQTYNRGLFDDDPEFRPAWSHYHRLWEQHTRGYSPLNAVWLRREQPDFEEARRQVVAVMVRVLRRQPAPTRVLARVLELSLTSTTEPGPNAAAP